MILILASVLVGLAGLFAVFVAVRNDPRLVHRPLERMVFGALGAAAVALSGAVVVQWLTVP